MGAAGRLGTAAIEPPVTVGTFFDLASLTKPLTALAAARLARMGKLDFSAPLGTWLPEVQRTPSARVPLDLFLAHRAGMSAYGALYRHLAKAGWSRKRAFSSRRPMLVGLKQRALCRLLDSSLSTAIWVTFSPAKPWRAQAARPRCRH